MLKIDMNKVQINLGPNVGDITIRYDLPRRGRVIPMAILKVKPTGILKVAVNSQGPKAQGRLKACRSEPRHICKTCIVRHV